MKKGYLLMLALCSSVAMTAGAQHFNAMPKAENHKLLTMGNTHMKQNANPAKMAVKKDAAAAAGIITEQPAGELKIMNRYSYGWYMSWFNPDCQEYHNGAAYVVFGEDNTVYFKNPLSKNITNTWMKGTIKDNEILIDLPQAIDVDENGNVLYLKNLKYNGSLQFSELEGPAKFIIDGEKITYAPETYGDIIGLCNGSEWMQYGDLIVELSPSLEEPLEIPADLNLEEYVLTYKNVDIFYPSVDRVKLAFDGDDVYFTQFPRSNGDNLWAKGKLENGKITFKNQFVGISDNYSTFSYFKATEAYPTWDDYGNVTDISFDLASETVFDFDPETKKLTSADESTSFLVVHGTREDDKFTGNDIFSFFLNPTIVPFVENAATPATPVIDYGEPFDPKEGYGAFQFNLETQDVDGNYIDPENLSYVIYLDDEPLVLHQDEYYCITDEMEGTTEIPYNFCSPYFDIIVCLGKIHAIAIFADGVDKYGVQLVNRAGDSVAKSDIAWIDLATGETGVSSGIKTVAATDGNIESVTYTDIAGRKLTAPQKGICIKTMKYADGTVKSEKILVK